MSSSHLAAAQEEGRWVVIFFFFFKRGVGLFCLRLKDTTRSQLTNWNGRRPLQRPSAADWVISDSDVCWLLLFNEKGETSHVNELQLDSFA